MSISYKRRTKDAQTVIDFIDKRFPSYSDDRKVKVLSRSYNLKREQKKINEKDGE